MKEIGSEFSLIKYGTKVDEYPIRWLPDCFDLEFTFSGRTAIDLALDNIKNMKKVLLPSYCCHSMIEPFRKRNLHIDFYDVNFFNKLTVSFPTTLDYDVVFLCNYFGFSYDYPNEILCRIKSSGGIIIEDITHSLFSDNQFKCYSDYLVASLRKWGDLISGGICCKVNGNLKKRLFKDPPIAFVDRKYRAMELKSEYLSDGDKTKKDKYLELYAETNFWLSNNYEFLNIDTQSKKTLSYWNFHEIKKSRIENAKILYNVLNSNADIQFMFPIEHMDCPLFIPIIVKDINKRNSIRKKLIKNDIYCPIHWPYEKDDFISNIYDRELSLICDQRYTKDDMLRIAEVINRI